MVVTSLLLNKAGLVLNMIGTFLAFFFGFPQPNHETEVLISVGRGTVFADGTKASDLEDTARRKKLLYRCMALLALSLVFIGFAAQAIALWFY
jgi:hypothetical protein